MSDPFEVLALPRTYFLDRDVLDAAYYTQQRSVHPDKATGAADRAALVNQAYMTLRDPFLRAEALLAELPEPPVDSAFLEQVLEGEIDSATLWDELEKSFKNNDLEGSKKVLSRIRYVRKR